jgi:hypothetical protein
MIKKCSKCEKLPDGPLLKINFVCQHEEAFCMDCIDSVKSDQGCTNCKKSVKPAKDMRACFKCEKEVDLTSDKNFQMINFKSCKTNSHSEVICSACFKEKFASLVHCENQKKRCYLCYSDLDKNKLLYYSESLNCKEEHKVHLCGKCHEIFNKVPKRCPKCEDIKPNQNLCVACYHPIQDKITILPINCDSNSHKFSICMNCASNLASPHLICRLCSNKPSTYYSYFQTSETNINELCIPSIKFISNSIDKNVFEIDEHICPTCEPISINYELVLSGDSNDEDDETWLNPFSSISKMGQNFVVSGGCNLVTGLSEDSTVLIKFIQDGRNKFYKTTIMSGAMLQNLRHSHSSFYYEKEKTLYAFGGAQTKSKNQITYLDSFECLGVIDDSINYNGAGEWQTCEFKLKNPRCNASTIVFGTRLYIFGGFSGISKREEKIEYLDLAKKNIIEVNLIGEWNSPIRPVLSVQGNGILVFGGFIRDESQNDKVCKVIKSSGKVEHLPSSGINVNGILNSVMVQNNFIIFGGVQNSSASYTPFKIKGKNITTGQEITSNKLFGRLLNEETFRQCGEYFSGAQIEFYFE